MGTVIAKQAQRQVLRQFHQPKLRPHQPIAWGSSYLVAYACFICRRSFKRAFHSDHQKRCPNCGGRAEWMGRSFQTPARSDRKQWLKVQLLVENGFVFASYRSHPDAEPLPARLGDTFSFLARNQIHPMKTRFRAGKRHAKG